MQHLPLLQEYLSSWQQGTLRSSPISKLIPAFHEQLGASSERQHAERVTLSPRQGAGYGAVPAAIPSCLAQIQLQPWSRYRVLDTSQLEPGCTVVPLESWHTSGPRMSTGRASWSRQLSPKNSAGHEPLAFVLFKSPAQNKRAEGMA